MQEIVIWHTVPPCTRTTVTDICISLKKKDIEIDEDAEDILDTLPEEIIAADKKAFVMVTPAMLGYSNYTYLEDIYAKAFELLPVELCAPEDVLLIMDSITPNKFYENEKTSAYINIAMKPIHDPGSSFYKSVFVISENSGKNVGKGMYISTDSGNRDQWHHEKKFLFRMRNSN